MEKELFVFDLDFTIWDAGGTWCDATNPPYHAEKGEVYDSSGKWIRLYPDVRKILAKLKEMEKLIAIASRTYEPDWANNLLQLFNIDHFFIKKEIYPDIKTTHFRNLQEHFQIDYNQMVFFDDEYRNVEEISRHGVECVLVRNGLSMGMVERYL
ncbi:MAG: magnesium-dependent phosphatase-1 [Mariniphaga sp.]|nr:magnesium-dependent phosphatase-1 [Mariniphaga sp.]